MSHHLRRLTATALGLTLCLGLVGCAAAEAGARGPVEVKLAQNSEARLAIVLAAEADGEVRNAAGVLKDYLERITGAAFDVTTGDGSSGIVLGLAGDFDAETLGFEPAFEDGSLGREDYLIRSSQDRLLLIGATPLAVRHAVWDTLHRAGYRQYFPGETWEIVPERPTLALAVNAQESPAFYARRIWYNWGLWGYNNEPYRQWSERNRVVQGFRLNSGHAYGAIHNANREAFEAHPEYYALIDGERRDRGGDSKFCIGNPGLRELVVNHAVREVQASPDLDSVSMDPSDGNHWCDAGCELCAKVGDGSVSDRVLLLANDVAEAINDLGLGEKYVGIYAYNRHAPPPTIEAHPNVIATATTHFVRAGYSLNEIIEGWSARGATLGIYDYFSVIAWDWNLPRLPTGEVGRILRVHDLAQRVTRYHEQGARYFDAESGDAWGPYGLAYYAAGRMLWDLDEAGRVDAIVDEFLDNAFGPAREPMARFYHHIALDPAKRVALADVIAHMYQSLAEARELAADRPDVLRRLDHLTLYTRYVELYKAYADAQGDARNDARKTLLAHAYRMRETSMVHALGLWRREARNVEGGTDDVEDTRPFTTEELAEILAAGVAGHELSPGMTFTPTRYSETLVPAAERLGLAEVDHPGSHPTGPTMLQNYFVWLDHAPAELDVKARVERRWVTRPHLINLYPPQRAGFGDVTEDDLIYCKYGCCAMAFDVKIQPIDSSDIVRPDGETYDVSLRSPAAGLHRVEVIDGGDTTHVTWPEGVRVTLGSGAHSPAANNHFRGSWTLYFYVPQGTRVVGGWASRVGITASAEPGVLRDGDGNVVFDFADHEDGYFEVPVPEGQAGRLWKFDDNQGQRLLMTVPPYMAGTARDLLLPEEVVSADRR